MMTLERQLDAAREAYRLNPSETNAREAERLWELLRRQWEFIR